MTVDLTEQEIRALECLIVMPRGSENKIEIMGQTFGVTLSARSVVISTEAWLVRDNEKGFTMVGDVEVMRRDLMMVAMAIR
jgi:hypothetical protein